MCEIAFNAIVFMVETVTKGMHACPKIFVTNCKFWGLKIVTWQSSYLFKKNFESMSIGVRFFPIVWLSLCETCMAVILLKSIELCMNYHW